MREGDPRLLPMDGCVLGTEEFCFRLLNTESSRGRDVGSGNQSPELS